MSIMIKNAYENNLKHINVEIPKNKLIAFTGVSGSGKSTLALHTIQRECQRLYMESLGMTLNIGSKAKVDSIKGLSPAISITQHQSNNNPRSTVGTITELSLYLRILFSKLGKVDSVELTANHFSYNNPLGACPTCNGLGIVSQVDTDQLMDKNKSINEYAIYGWDQVYIDRYGGSLLAAAKYYGLTMSLDIPICNYDKIQLDLLFYGVLSEQFSAHFPNMSPPKTVSNGRFEGIVTNILRRYAQENISLIQKKKLENYFIQDECPQCKGKKFNHKTLSIYVNDKNIQSVLAMSFDKLHHWIRQLKSSLSEFDLEMLNQLMNTIESKLMNLIDVGVEYLCLDQSASTLSSGEWQRIKLATVMNSGLTGVLYILDEPSAGLHFTDIEKLVNVLKRLRDLGNTVIVIEHHLKIIEAVDWIIDFGPGAGRKGGEIIAQGIQNEIINNAHSLTGQYLQMPYPKIDASKKSFTKFLSINNASLNNIHHINTKIPLNAFVTITGVSGSGKTSLVFGIVAKLALEYFSNKNRDSNEHIAGIEHLDGVVVIDHHSVGRSSRSNIATYTDIFSEIRKLFSQISIEFSAKDFSTNTIGGRCEECQGQGVIPIAMHFLPDVYVTCPICNGKRFKEGILHVKYNDYNISEILTLDIHQAMTVFKNETKIYNHLSILDEIGLGYLILGQSTASLSGGEAQRVKLAKELMDQANSHKLYLFDEPTTGLHPHDICKVIEMLRRIVEAGSSVLVIDHNLTMIAKSDYIIDMGLKGGENGGCIIAEGTPKEVADNAMSITGQILKEFCS